MRDDSALTPRHPDSHNMFNEIDGKVLCRDWIGRGVQLLDVHTDVMPKPAERGGRNLNSEVVGRTVTLSSKKLNLDIRYASASAARVGYPQYMYQLYVI